MSSSNVPFIQLSRIFPVRPLPSFPYVVDHCRKYHHHAEDTPGHLKITALTTWPRLR